MREFDLIVIGGGSGTAVGDAAADQGEDVAVVEPGPLGGACVTRGCVPSKGLIHRADVVEGIRRAGEFGVDADVEGVDFASITAEIEDAVYEKAERMERQLRESDRKTLFDAEAEFVDERTVSVDGEELRGEQVVVAAGARPSVPPIDGLEDADYLTSAEALYLDERPDRLVILGGGYVGAELGHFFGEMGAEVAIVGRSDRLVPREDAAAGEAVTAAFEERHDVYAGHEATAVEERNGEFVVTAEPSGRDDGGGESVEVIGDELLVATGREPNTDRLDVKAAGIETTDGGFVETDEYLESSVDGVWALGDIAGPPLFKHAADYEARVVARNAVLDDEEEPDYTGLGHAVFTSPRVAAVGKTEAELRDDGGEYESARAEYADVPLGTVAKDERGFAKVLADPADGEILGCHVVGEEAPTLLHEVLVALRSGGGTVDDVAETIHVHPARNEVLLKAFDELAEIPYAGTPDWSDVTMGEERVGEK